MKARKVKGLDPAGTFADNARRIVAVRAQEVLDLGSRAQQPEKVKPLHDLRIAAKRLRYVLELSGPEAPVKRLKALQDVLGELHDCDVRLPPIRSLARAAPEHEAHGLRSVAIHVARRRAECFERFHQAWPEIEREIGPLASVEVSR